MKRSAGVTIAAVVALLGSAFLAYSAILGFFSILSVSRFSPAGQTRPEFNQTQMLAAAVMGSLVDLGLAGWGILTGIGLLRLKTWSRISVLVFAGALALVAAFGVLIIMFLPLPGRPNAGQGYHSFFRVIAAPIWFIPLSVSVWWLVFFSRKSVVAQFSAAPVAADYSPTQAFASAPVILPGPPSMQRPVLLTIIAWFYLGSAILNAPWYFMGQMRTLPFPFFGTVLEGRVMTIFFALSLILLLAGAIGLLKDQIWGYWLTLGLNAFNLMNAVAILLLPGRPERFEKITAAFQRNFPMELPNPQWNYLGMFLTGGWTIVMIVSALLLWFLWECRLRFFEFVAMKAQTSRTMG
jgi:hypothetical protein